jgi:hypothetical protein
MKSGSLLGGTTPPTCPKVVPRIRRPVIVTSPKGPTTLLPKPCPKKRRAPPPTKSSLSDMNDVIQITSKYVMLFVFFTSSLNWLHYRNLRKMNEEDSSKK